MRISIWKNCQKEMKSDLHESVLIAEVIESLHIEKGRKYIDATLGNAGHTLEILNKGGDILGIELDPRMVKISEERIKSEGVPASRWKIINDNFVNIDKITEKENWKPVSGILFDLGVTNLHLKDTERGFSFENPEASLDMRINPELEGVKAADLLNILREDQLINLFEITLDPGPAKWITGRVVHSRAVKPIATVGDLLEASHGLKTGRGGLNEATLPFLALRIAVNSELTNLEEALPKAFDLLEKGGRLVIISFHSKEDAIVKNFFKEKKNEGSEIITFKPILASQEEMNINHKSRSAKMRVIQK